jgi:putative (di)nucleoside polyphosphate hydrolase
MPETERPYRANVGAVIRRDDGRILMAERIDRPGAWQFPQGGVEPGESLEAAMWRELGEELGLSPPQHTCRLVAAAPAVRYSFPPGERGHLAKRYAGQEQTLFLLAFTGRDADFRLDAHPHPEFRAIRWVWPEEALELIWEVKRPVFQAMLHQMPEAFASSQD